MLKGVKLFSGLNIFCVEINDVLLNKYYLYYNI